MAKRFISDIEHSRRPWGTTRDEKWPEDGYERTKAGCLQRIAAATEAMAKSHIQLQTDYDYMRDSRDRYRAELEKAKSQIRGLKGAITRMKKK